MRFRPLVLVLSLVALVTACGGEPAHPLVGRWRIDKEGLREALAASLNTRLAGMNPQMRMLAERRMRERLEVIENGEMTTTFEADGRWAMRSVAPDGETRTMSGTWKQAGEIYELTPETEGDAPMQREALPLRLRLEGDRLIALTEKGSRDPEIRLKRD